MADPSFPLEPTPIHVPDAVLDDLRTRLRLTRLPPDAGNDDGFYGVRRGYLEELVDYWLHRYDWRAAEAAINAYEHYRVSVDGVPVHFMRTARRRARPRSRSSSPTAGRGPSGTGRRWSTRWPTRRAFGGDPADAFDVIVPSLPGFGFSTPLPDRPDMNFWKAADVWHQLMTGVLGHERYAAAGCDVGALVTGQLGHKYAAELHGIHIGSGLRLDFFNGDRAWDFSGGRPIPDGLPDDVRRAIVALDRKFAVHLAAHMLDSSTLAHGLSDSPAGLLAWILERWTSWSDSRGDIENVFSKDDLLTHAMIFWVTNSIGTSMRYYANANRYPWTPAHGRRPAVEAPTGITFVGYENPPGVSTDRRVEHFLGSDRAGWYRHVNLTAHQEGGHFIPWEIPDEWVADLRRTFRRTG